MILIAKFKAIQLYVNQKSEIKHIYEPLAFVVFIFSILHFSYLELIFLATVDDLPHEGDFEFF
jgi:hypothetical protein